MLKLCDPQTTVLLLALLKPQWMGFLQQAIREQTDQPALFLKGISSTCLTVLQPNTLLRTEIIERVVPHLERH